VLIHVDLATGTVVADPGVGPAYARGGPLDALDGLHAALVRDGVPADAADAPVALVAGPVAGVAAPGLARLTAIGLSPRTGGVAETRTEGPFAATLRGAGVTGVVLHGRAPAPVIVHVHDGTATLVDAGDVWGLETGPATDALAARFPADAGVAVIGPAGECGVRYATVVTARHHPLPRHGFGALLGGKRVKAVVCTGAAIPPVADPGRVAEIGAAYAAGMAANPLTAAQHGRPGFGVWRGEPGYAAVANFADTRTPSGVDPATAPVGGTISACPGCPNDCVKVYGGAGLHQEALAALGANIGHPDPWRLNARCEQLGLDPVALGGTLAATVGPPDDIDAVVEDIAAGRAPHLARGAAFVANGMSAGGVELPPFDPRAQPNLALSWVVAPFGPRYDAVEHDLDFDPDTGMPGCFPETRALGVDVPRRRGVLDPTGTAILMRLWSGLDALGVCLFAATPTRLLGLTAVADLVEAVTGERPDVLALGGRRLLVQHAINRLAGVPASALPDRFMTEPLAAGPWAGAVLDRVAFDQAAAELRAELGLRP